MVKKGLKIYMTYGSKGSGKSLSFARDTYKVVRQIKKSIRKYPQLPHREILFKGKLSNEFLKFSQPVVIRLWEDVRDIRICQRENCWKKNPKHAPHNSDIFWDEVGSDFSAGSWIDTPRWIKLFFSYCRKRQNRIFMNTQVYEDTDVSFRRQIDHAEECTKLIGSRDVDATRPPVKYVWGIIIRRSHDPRILEFEHDPLQREAKETITKKIYWDIAIPRPMPIRQKYVSIYDTTDENPPTKPIALEHTILYCEDPDCPQHGIKSGKPKYSHKQL